MTDTHLVSQCKQTKR